MDPILSFSKLSKEQKIDWLESKTSTYDFGQTLKSFWHHDANTQNLLEEFSENTVSNFFMPFGIAPNFLINQTLYHVPMVIEESSVVAAASKAAKFWHGQGGFQGEILGTTKNGQVSFFWQGDFKKLEAFLNQKKSEILNDLKDLTDRMKSRGGGVQELKLLDLSHLEPDLRQLHLEVDTCDAMGANFINSLLEKMGATFRLMVAQEKSFNGPEREVEILMGILSNYTPECRVKVEVQCPLKSFAPLHPGMTEEAFAKKFHRAVRLAKIDPKRAVTHNKGILNGVDSVILATGNDFRAVEACAHSYAAKEGQYQGLSYSRTEDQNFIFGMELPLAVGTVGGLTNLHPLVKMAMDLLGRPKATELMTIAASVGLACNFSAITSLITSGIQKGHMKMHLFNILNTLEASPEEKDLALKHFTERTVSFHAVKEFLKETRGRDFWN